MFFVTLFKEKTYPPSYKKIRKLTLFSDHECGMGQDFRVVLDLDNQSYEILFSAADRSSIITA